VVDAHELMKLNQSLSKMPMKKPDQDDDDSDFGLDEHET